MTDMWGASQIHYILCVGRTLNWEGVEYEGDGVDDHGCGLWHKVAYHTIITDSVLFPAGVNSVMLVSIVSFIVFVVQGGDLIIGIPFRVGSFFLAYTV